MPKDEALLLVPGLRPIKFEKTPWYEVEPFKSWAGNNPHERHAKSPRTWFSLRYSEDAQKLTAPLLDDFFQRMKTALRVEAAAHRTPRLKRIRFTDFIWLPVAAGLAGLVLMIGTPHVLFEYAARADARGHYACTYVGASGLRFVKQSSPCSLFRFLQFQTS